MLASARYPPEVAATLAISHKTVVSHGEKMGRRTGAKLAALAVRG